MSESFENALFSLTGSVEAVRETIRDTNLGTPLKNQPTLNLEQEANDVITLLKETNEIYINKLDSTNALVSKLMGDLEFIKHELDNERKYTKELKAQLDSLKNSQ
jgi:hypothetical protein